MASVDHEEWVVGAPLTIRDSLCITHLVRRDAGHTSPTTCFTGVGGRSGAGLETCAIMRVGTLPSSNSNYQRKSSLDGYAARCASDAPGHPES